MALSMAHPWKHPDTGYYWFRKRVPDDLRAIVGKREERFSLRTREPSEAKRRHAHKLAEIEERWSNLRRGQRPLLADEITSEAAAIGNQVRKQLEADPYRSLNWNVEVGSRLWAEDSRQELYTDITAPLSPDQRTKFTQRSTCVTLVDEWLVSRGLATDEADRKRLARAASIEMQRIAQEHNDYLQGRTDALVFRSPPIGSPTRRLTPLSFKTVVDGWVAEKKPTNKTEYVWRRVIQQLSDFLGHDDARRISADDLVGWKADLLAKGLKAKTIRDSKLAPVRAVLQWATDNRKIDTNPGARINIDLKARSSEKRRGYTDDEAKIILKAARKEKEAHRRWTPWVCAYTGARIAEICQLRFEDIKQIDGIWCIAFAAEAGSLKNVNSERVVPVHAALKDEGFLKFVTSVRKGPLFAELGPDRFGSRGGN